MRDSEGSHFLLQTFTFTLLSITVIIGIAITLVYKLTVISLCGIFNAFLNKKDASFKINETPKTKLVFEVNPST